MIVNFPSASTPERVLRFDAERSLGRVLVRPQHATGDGGWVQLADARWSVLVPSDMEVRLWVEDATDDALGALDGVPADGLRELVLLAQPVEDAAMRHVGRLRGLRVLDLFRTWVTDKGLVAVAELVDLEWLSLTRCAVTDVGVSRLTSLRALRRLSLKETHIVGACLAALGDLPELRWLSLTGTRVGDDSLRDLAKLPKLEVLSVARTEVTVDGMAWWWRERPDVQVVAH